MLFLWCSCASGIDADAVATEFAGGFDPAHVVCDCVIAYFFIGVSEFTFVVAHDEKKFYIVIIGAFFEFFEVLSVL